MVGDGGGLMHKMEGFYRIEMVLFFSPPAAVPVPTDCIVAPWQVLSQIFQRFLLFTFISLFYLDSPLFNYFYIHFLLIHIGYSGGQVGNVHDEVVKNGQK